MQGKHWIIVGAMLGAVALQIGSLDYWTDAVKPQFIAGVLLALSSTITAMFTDKPSNGNGKVSASTVAKIGAVVLAASLMTSAAGCAHFAAGGARQVAVAADTAVYVAVTAVDDAEWTAWKGGLVTDAQHAALNPYVRNLLQAGKRVNDAVRQHLVPDVVAVRQALTDFRAALQAFPDSPGRQKVEQALLRVDLALAGGH